MQLDGMTLSPFSIGDDAQGIAIERNSVKAQHIILGPLHQVQTSVEQHVVLHSFFGMMLVSNQV